MNKAIIIGNLGQDPETRSTQSGQTVTNFSVATSRKWKDRDGNRKEETEWHRCVAWGRTAEICGQYLHKGSKVAIEGRLQTRKWEKPEGHMNYSTEIVVDQMHMLGEDRGARSEQQQSLPEQGYNPASGDDDIPF